MPDRATPWPHAPKHQLSESGAYLGTYLKAHYFLFSAKAACSFKPRTTPQVTTSFQKQALKARINRDYREVNRAFSADDFLSL
jgi:hypothetical protein